MAPVVDLAFFWESSAEAEQIIDDPAQARRSLGSSQKRWPSSELPGGEVLAGGKLFHILYSLQNAAWRSSGFQAPSSAIRPIQSERGSVASRRARQKLDKAELAPSPPSRNEPVRWGREAKDMELQLRELGIAGHLELGFAKGCGDAKLFGGIAEGLGSQPPRV